MIDFYQLVQVIGVRKMAVAIQLSTALVAPHLKAGRRIDTLRKPDIEDHNCDVITDTEFEQSGWQDAYLDGAHFALIQALTYDSRGAIRSYGQAALNPGAGEEQLIVWQERKSEGLEPDSDSIPEPLHGAFVSYPAFGPCLS